MPAHRTGTAFFRNGKWHARVTLRGDERPSYELPTCTGEEVARARAKLLADLAARLVKAGQLDFAPTILGRAASAEDGEALKNVVALVAAVCAGEFIGAASTFGEVAKQWTSGELAKAHPDHVARKRSSKSDVNRLDLYILPTLRDIPITRLTLEHAEAVMRALPADLSKGSRRHVAQIMGRILNLCVYPLRLITVSPIPRGWLPPAGRGRESEALWPDEEARLMAHEARPLCSRVLLGFMAREGCRPGEAAALTWKDLDLERSGITLDRNKTDDPRGWTLDAGVVRALAAWKKLRSDVAPDDHVFVDELGAPVVRWVYDDAKRTGPRRPELTIRADVYRGWLVEAGITRALLTEESDKRRPTRIHDLRGLFVTTALATGRSESWVADRTGHASSQMINRYRRRARRHEEANLGGLTPLDLAIPEFRPAAEASPEASPRRRTAPRRRRGFSNHSRVVGHEGLEPSANGLREQGEPACKSESGAKRPVSGTERAPPAPAGTLQVRVGTLQPSPREGLVADLTRRIVEATTAGDTEAAWVAIEALERLFGGAPGPVVDLGVERRRRKR